MIKTLSDYNLLESEEWKDSINTLFLELRSKLPEFFKEVPLPTIPHEDYVEVVIPASKQVMMEDLVEWLEKKLGLHILYASKQNYGKLLKAAAYSTSVPFVFHYCIKPKAASSDKWSNFSCFLSARMPWLKRKALAVKAWISYVYHKMYRSDNGRKFFTLVLVICMLVFQVVDFHAAKEACSFQVEWAAKGKALSLTPYDIGLPGIDGEVELGPKSFMENILYPFQTSLWVYMVALMMTLLLFSYRLADLNPTHGWYGLSVQAASTCSRDEKQVAQQVKAWGWSRPAVLAFVDQLQKYEILEVCNMVASKVVHLKPSIFSSGLSPTPSG
ncbi:hypothetical protein [Segatella copri]|jgi:hypothetical protein|uniref:Uncharacterized protein n=1 Tax=Segatella copri TaxID=165179 RepID=A0AA90UZQ3_9BACT|nr:hypothetical protein [Segatella copri]MQN84664.1 hypothetical protein [Segatella copri]